MEKFLIENPSICARRSSFWTISALGNFCCGSQFFWKLNRCKTVCRLRAIRILALEFISKNEKRSRNMREAKCPRGDTQSCGELFFSVLHRLTLPKIQKKKFVAKGASILNSFLDVRELEIPQKWHSDIRLGISKFILIKKLFGEKKDFNSPSCIIQF